MCDKAVDDFLPALKFVLDWFVTSKMIKELEDALFINDGNIFINEHSNNVTCFGGEMSIFNVDNINLDDGNFDEDNPDLIILIHIRLMAWHNRYKQHISSEI